MQEPTASKMPAAYDDDETLFGAFVNHRILTVKYQVDVEVLDVVVNEDCSALCAPIYLTFEGGEIWFVGAGGLSQNGSGEWVFSLESNYEQRALHGSPLQPHMVGEKVYVGLLSQHVIMAKRVLQASQKYRFLVGTDAERIATTPVVGERFLCSDTKRIYYCLVPGTWTWMNRTHHADLDGLADDDHPQYAQLDDLTGWHDPNGHIVGGDAHDHTSTNQGVPATRIRSSTLVAMGAPVCIGDACMVTDVDGGSFFYSFDGVTWESMSGIPSGAIAMFTGACPTGWSRYTALDDRFPMGSVTPGVAGGGTTHVHTYTQFLAHTHTVNQQVVNSDSKGSHTHTVTIQFSSGGSQSTLGKYGGNSTWGTDSQGSHSHTISIPARDSGSTGSSPATTASASSLPPYQEVMFCQKA